MSELIYSCDNCGEHAQPNSGRASASGEVAPPYVVKITNTTTGGSSTSLENCIQFNSGGRVFGIRVDHSNLPGEKYAVYVDAQGPSGITEGSGYLRFIDYSGDHYDLSIYDSDRKLHNVMYSSDRPGIQTILWSDESF